MRVLLDTNVLLAALVSPSGPPDRLYRAWRAGRFELLTSAEQTDELRRASRYPKLRAILPPHRAGALVNHLHRAVMLAGLPPPPPALSLNDAADAFLVAMAIGGEAQWLVTGDRRAGLLAMGRIGSARVVTPAVFCREVLD
jgi:putative PIN family toxin of toxin-antitoxin system